MRVRVLGSAAGGGFPQWNCGCDNCLAARRGERGVLARTQESVAISADSETWFLLNCSPEVRAQLESFAPLHPRAPRHSPVAGIVITNGDLDHCLGLLSLRESYPMGLYATASTERGFREGNVLHRTLQRFEGQLQFQALELGRSQDLRKSDGSPSGLTIEAVPVPGKLPIHLEALRTPSLEDNVGLLVREPARGRTLAYFPGVAGPCTPLLAALREADGLFFDGTFWSSDELPGRGLGDKRAEDMAHWPVGGPSGSLELLRTLPARCRRVLIHVNNTNPMLRPDSSEAQQLSAAGVELAYDGMELEV